MDMCVMDGVWGNIIWTRKVGRDKVLWWDVMHYLWRLQPPRSQKQDCPDNLPLPDTVTVHKIREIMHACAKTALTETHTHNSCGDTHMKTSHCECTHTSCSHPPLSSCLSFSADRGSRDADIHCESWHCLMSQVLRCLCSEVLNMLPSGVVIHCMMKSEAGVWGKA